MSIKNLIPNNPRFKSGLFDVSKSIKYDGVTPVIYRSGLELRFFNLFETSKDYLKWSSEPDINIQYLLNGKTHRYNIDVSFLSNKNKKFYIAEIKPFAETQYPKNGKQFAIDNFNKNVAKWTAAKQFAIDNGWEFCILTERFLK